MACSCEKRFEQSFFMNNIRQFHACNYCVDTYIRCNTKLRPQLAGDKIVYTIHFNFDSIKSEYNIIIIREIYLLMTKTTIVHFSFVKYSYG